MYIHWLTLVQLIHLCATASISPNLKTVVYVGGIKYGGDAEWQFIRNRFEQTQIPSEKSKLLHALSASTDVLVLNRYCSIYSQVHLLAFVCVFF